MYTKKSLGQYFLRCRWVVNTIARAAELTQRDIVLEIGPGTGVLTRALAHRAEKVIAVEKDHRLADDLTVTLNRERLFNVDVVKGDILACLKSNSKPKHRMLGTRKFKAIGNIPYYLTSRLLRLLLEGEPRPELIVLTIQKEVAARIVARPPHMNLLGLSVQAFGKPEIIKTVPASCFSPAPKVDSAIIKISDISDHFFQENDLDKAEFFGLIRRAFSQKRKLLLNTISVKHRVFNKREIAAALKDIGLSAKARPEELSLQNWADLAKSL